jgi:cell division protein FtsI/penicillin-binding protein 2
MSTRARTRLAVLPSLALLAAALTACTDQDEAVQEAADTFAAGLTAGDVSASAGAEAQKALETIREPLGDTEPTVSVEQVSGDSDEKRTVTLAWTWDVGPGDDTDLGYTSKVTFTRTGDDWRPEWAPTVVHPDLGDGETVDTRTLSPERADVLGAGGAKLVTARPLWSFGLDKSRIDIAQVRSSARAIAAFLDVDAKAYVKLAEASGPKAFVEALALRPADGRSLPIGFSDIPGAGVVKSTRHLGITREFAAPILGRVGPVTAEIVEESEGRYRAGDEAGLSGLEARYDEQLAGKPGAALVAIDADGEERPLVQVDPEPGEPLVLTLDVRRQKVAEAVLADLPASAGRTALVAIQPSTGAVLAAANGPANDGFNAATYSQYAPGSTFKVVTSLALLRAGLTPQTPVSCPRTVDVDGKDFENYDDYPADGYGEIPLATALANSCNTAFVGQRDKVDGSALADAAASLGLGVDRDLGAPAYFGQVPQPEGETELAADTIGQGKVLASPLVMATVAASVAAGKTVVPHLVDGVSPSAEGVEPLTSAESRALRSMMEQVVKSGSGRVLSLFAQGAKTGTAEYGDPRPDGSLATHAWMIAFDGDLAVAAFVEKGASGSGVAGPVLADFLRQAG